MAERPRAADDAGPFRSGIVAVVGRPNVGKSTLVNALVGQKVAIVSDKPQTTRRDIRAIVTDDEAQIVYTDTPGFHKPRTLLGTRLNDLVGDAVDGVDVVVQVVDGAAGVGRGDAYVYEQKVATAGAPAICVVNKIDAVRNRAEVPQLVAAAELGAFEEVVPVSAATGDGVDTVRALILARLPEGLPLYPPDDITDQTIENRLAELIREQALLLTREEVPHSITAHVEEIDEKVVRASVIVETESQKTILVGKGGSVVRKIGMQARPAIEQLLGRTIYLELHVKVRPKWRQNEALLERFGI